MIISPTTFISQLFQGYSCESGIAISARRVTCNYLKLVHLISIDKARIKLKIKMNLINQWFNNYQLYTVKAPIIISHK